MRENLFRRVIAATIKKDFKATIGVPPFWKYRLMCFLSLLSFNKLNNLECQMEMRKQKNRKNKTWDSETPG